MSNGLENRNKAFEHQTLQTAKHTKNGKFCWTALLHKIQYKVIRNICETFSLRIYVWSTSLWNRLVNHSPTCVDNYQAKKYIFLNSCVAAGLLHGTLEQLKTGRPLFIDQTASIQSTIQQFNAILRTFSFQSKLP